jgi:hypothetical protein
MCQNVTAPVFRWAIEIDVISNSFFILRHLFFYF